MCHSLPFVQLDTFLKFYKESGVIADNPHTLSLMQSGGSCTLQFGETQRFSKSHRHLTQLVWLIKNTGKNVQYFTCNSKVYDKIMLKCKISCPVKVVTWYKMYFRLKVKCYVKQRHVLKFREKIPFSVSCINRGKDQVQNRINPTLE